MYYNYFIIIRNPQNPVLIIEARTFIASEGRGFYDAD